MRYAGWQEDQTFRIRADEGCCNDMTRCILYVGAALSSLLTNNDRRYYVID